MQNEKPTITYPCTWEYKVIGNDEDLVRLAVKSCLEECLADGPDGRPYQLEFSRTSGQGKYVSLTLSLVVTSEQERNDLFQTLADRPEIRLVI